MLKFMLGVALIASVTIIWFIAGFVLGLVFADEDARQLSDLDDFEHLS